MIRTLITKEILNNIMNLRFTISLLLSTVLTISCVVILTHQYHEEMDDYTYRQSLQDEFLDNYAHTNRIGGIITPQKPPEVFRPFIVGIPHEADEGSFDDNPLPVLFPHIDFLFIVTIIMSLMAILFLYDAVTGERSNGTMKLQTTYPLSRALILFGKWVGDMVSLLFPFLLSLVVGALYITVHPQIHWDGSIWLSFVLLFLAFVTFISLFFLLGLFISTLTRFSSVSIIASLFVWVMLVLVIPNTSPHIAAQLYRIPSVTRVKHEINLLTSIERDEMGRELTAKVGERFSQEYGQRFTEYRSMSNADIRKRVAADSDLKAMHEAYRKERGQAWNEANRIQNEKANKISDELYKKATNQTIIAKNISCISPYVKYVFAATDLTGTGLRSRGFFNSNFREIEYLYYSSDDMNLAGPESRGLGHFGRSSGEYTRRYYEYQGEKVSEASKADPTFDSNAFLDISDRPRFSYREEPLKDRLQAVLLYFGILMFFNVLFFAGAFVKFIGYDVR